MNIPLFKVFKPARVSERVSTVLDSGYWAEGNSVRRFELLLQSYLYNKNIISTNSCTSALHLAMHMYGVGPGNYVIASPQNCIASNVSITNLHAIPIWADVDPVNGMLTAETIENTYNALSEDVKQKVKVIVYVIWGGDLGDAIAVDALCKRLNIPLIIDAAQGFSLRYNRGQNILGDGNLGDMTCFSFQAIKHITTGDGGAIAFRDESLCKKAFVLKWFGVDRESFRTPTGEINWSSDVPEIGYKFHMNNIAGEIGCCQLEDPTFQQRMFKYLLNDFALRGAFSPYMTRSWEGATSAWVSTMNVDNPHKLLAFLKQQGIDTSQMHVNNNIYTGFKGALTPLPLDGVKQFMDHHLCFPCGFWVGEEEIEYMSKAVAEFYSK